MSRKREQAELLYKLGALFGPLLRMADNIGTYDADERVRIMARFLSEKDEFANALNQFARSEPGHNYIMQCQRAQYQIEKITAHGSYGAGDEDTLLKLAREAAPEVRNIIVSIPVPIDSTIYEARTQFSTYCFVRDLCSTVHQRIVWLDRYFDHTIFHRFFSEVDSSAQVTLVTLSAASLTQPRDKARHVNFLDVSRLFAAERGPQGYRLVENDQFHDRWLQCDDKLFTLGGSIKDLSKPFTISKLDSTAENLKHLSDALAGGREIFGPANVVHP